MRFLIRLGTLENQVVIKAGRRCENMVRVCLSYFSGEEMDFCQVWRCAYRDVGVDDPRGYFWDTIRDARLSVLDAGTIQ